MSSNYRKNMSEEDILSLASSFRKSKVLLTSLELGIFSLIGYRELNSKDIAYELNTDPDATERLLNALTSLDLIEKEKNHYRNTSHSIKFLVKSSPDYLGSLMHMNINWSNWGKLTDVIKTGNGVYKNLYVDRDEDFVEAYISSVHRSYRHEGKEIVSAINLKNVERMMDLGCGSGLYTIEFQRANPSMKITCLDYPKVIKQTKKHLEDMGANQDNIEYVESHILNDDFDGKYDLIYASFLFEEFSIWDNIEIMKKCYDALNPGGRLIIHENILDNDRTAPASGAIYSVNLLLHTEKGNLYTENDFWIMLKESGFQKVDNLQTEFNTILVRGTRMY